MGGVVAQYLKDDVRERIDRAALEVFAREGVAGATMARIAKAAGISAGNIYHYVPDKQALFERVLPASFVRTFERRLRARVRSLSGVDDVATLAPAAAFHRLAEDLLSFALEHRLRMIVLLGHADGTPYAAYPDRLAGLMHRLALAHASSVSPGGDEPPALHDALRRVYRHWVAVLAEILEVHDDERAIRDAVGLFMRYHLSGMQALLRAVVVR
jgi:AcrR family transcriptional regulator